jgi:hypothetical protein
MFKSIIREGERGISEVLIGPKIMPGPATSAIKPFS